jgi:hypothetical protein
LSFRKRLWARPRSFNALSREATLGKGTINGSSMDGSRIPIARARIESRSSASLYLKILLFPPH